MKEMTQEQKAEAYSKAVEKAKQEYNTATSEDRKQWLEELFPELRESEDELTWLTRYIEEEAYSLSMDIRDNEDRIKLEKLKKSLAWLEKQGEQKPCSWKPTEEQFEALDYAYNSCSDTERGNYYEGVLGTLIEDLHRLEKQGEVKSANNIVETWKDMRLEVYQQASGNRHEPNYSDDTTKMFSLNDIDEIIEKMSEQKPADNVEPKFKADEWIIRSAEGFKHNTYLVKEVKDYYVCEDLKGRRVTFTFSDVHKNFKLWDISYAKNGDVLVENKSGVILMFRRIGNIEWDDVIDYHCYYDCYRKGFIVQEDVQYWGNTENCQLKPAAKEQRDLLFQKMKESGYEWDDDKKELKKIDQKSYGQRKECLYCQFNYAGECKGSCQMKINEQIHIDEVESKFHEGDWVIDKQGIVYQVANVVENVTNHTYGYDIVGGGYFNDNSEGVRLWTISDAKDGDVLVASNGSIFLFAGVVDCACKYYAALATDGYVKINKEAKDGYWETSRAVYPATKEQRDKLEKAMSDAGYAFDFDKKELKKIRF